MIKFTREETKVKVSIESGVINYTYHLLWNCTDDVYAELLQRQFQNKMEEKLTAIRKEAYEDGYKDGRGKKAKKSWFKCWW